MLIGGAVLGTLGLGRAWLLGQLERAAGRLPLASRIALRDHGARSNAEQRDRDGAGGDRRRGRPRRLPGECRGLVPRAVPPTALADQISYLEEPASPTKWRGVGAIAGGLIPGHRQ